MPLTLSQSKLVKRWPSKYRDDPVFRDFALGLEEILKEEIWENSLLLSKIREPRGLERIHLALTAKSLGLEVDAEWLTDKSFTRVVESLSVYYESAGTKDFYRFMGFMVDTQFDMGALWTEDYLTFSSGVPPSGVEAYEGGTWFLTPHVELVYDGEDYGGGLPAISNVFKLFYLMAPINLVLERIVERFNSFITTQIAMAGDVIDYVLAEGDSLYFFFSLAGEVTDYVLYSSDSVSGPAFPWILDIVSDGSGGSGGGGGPGVGLPVPVITSIEDDNF
jgi:hypothetical protein